MKASYRAPTLTRYGRARELTFGSSGGTPDLNVITHVQSITNPNCADPEVVSCNTTHL